MKHKYIFEVKHTTSQSKERIRFERYHIERSLVKI